LRRETGIRGYYWPLIPKYLQGEFSYVLKYENKRTQKINEIAVVIKLLSVFFCSFIVYTVIDFYPLYGMHSLLNINDTLTIVVLCTIATMVLILIYESFIFFYVENKESKHYNIKVIIETASFLVVFSLLVIFSGGYESPYKFIYLFVIISTTIQFGIKHGMYVSVLSSLFLLILDLVSRPFNEVNQYFEIDIVLSGIFLLSAWLLGYYVKIENEHRELLLNYANHDSLTGLKNHRYFQDLLDSHVDIALKESIPLSMLFIDIDYFKHYNDINGHIIGDDTLKKLAEVLENSVRKNDIVSRYGGEEFAIILPNADEKEAVVIAERIRKAISLTKFKSEENQPSGNLTVSIGVSSIPEKAKDKQNLLNSADNALYRAKSFNKNRVETYSSVIDELINDVEEEHVEIISSIKTMIGVINKRDNYTFAHTERVIQYSRKLGEKLGISKDELKILRYGAYLHDIGKIQIPVLLLNKKPPLTKKEYALLQKHPYYGAKLVEIVSSIKDVIPLILHHHEKYDGSGYPDGLKGEDIPYLVRILTVADSFDAMTSNRPYKNAMSIESAIQELNRCILSQFDPYIVEKFVEILGESEIEIISESVSLA
jgi:diguanylate cyclase (GGDEF)-like protein